MGYRRYNKSNDSLVLGMFGQGLSILRIAKSLDVSPASITKVVKNGYPDWDGRKILPVKDIVKRYNAGETVESISIDLSVSHATIKSRLTENGVELRLQSEYQRKHFFDDGFFESIDTEPKAYWLGYLFADGNISSRMMDVSVVSKDMEHLIKLGKDIKYTGPSIYTELQSSIDSYSAGKSYYKVNLRSEKMCIDLIDKGCIPNKSMDLDAPSNLPKYLEKHFIRGVIDGDGYVSGAGFPSLEIVGAYNLLSWINDRMGGNKIRPHKTIWRIRLSGTKAVEYMKYLYEDSTVSLSRKAERAKINYDRS